jgi:uncharacterized protein YkwD
MVPSGRAPLFRRLAAGALPLVIGAALLAPTPASATTTMPTASEINAAEIAMVNAINADRQAVGLVGVRVDTRLMAIAGARSADMVAKDYFSHTQPDGRNLFDILNAQRITWYNAGEIIAWNNYPMDSTVSAGNRQWMGSPSHKAIILSKDLNYIGVGLALDPDTGKKIWTADFIKGPDRTGAKAVVAAPTISAGSTSTSRRAYVSWSGSDVRLQVLTAGLKSFRVERRIDGGAWSVVWSGTTLRAATFSVGVKHLTEFRIYAIDNRGNMGAPVTRAVDLR